MENKIYITGIGSVTSLGYGNAETWDNYLSEKSTITVDHQWKNEQIGQLFFGQPSEVQFDQEISWSERFPPNLYSRLGILACKKALDDAGIILATEDNDIGLIIETSFGATESVEDYLDDLYRYGVQKVSPIKFTKTVANTVLGDISRLFKLNGSSSLIYNNNSIAYGIDLINKGMAHTVVCGGVDHYTEYRLLSLQETGKLILADSPGTRYEVRKHFSTDNNKFIPGNGAAFVVLETAESARRRGAKVYAELADYQTNFDYENVENAQKRSDFILKHACDFYTKFLQADKKAVYMAPYTNENSRPENETWLLNELGRNSNISSVNHKAYTGDMAAASSIMGTALAALILKNDPSEIETALIGSSHEGGASSQIVLKAI